jgi:hypothetical protein
MNQHQPARPRHGLARLARLARLSRLTAAAGLACALAACGGVPVRVDSASTAVAAPAGGTASGNTASGNTAPGSAASGSTDGGQSSSDVGGAGTPFRLSFGAIAASDPAQTQVAGVWKRYWVLRTGAYATSRLDLDALASVASGEAVDEIVTDVRTNRAAGRHLEGTFTIEVPSIVIEGTEATVVGCVAVDARMVDRDGTVVEQSTSVPPQISTLRRTGTGWQVVTVDGRSDDAC